MARAVTEDDRAPLAPGGPALKLLSWRERTALARRSLAIAGARSVPMREATLQRFPRQKQIRVEIP